MKYSLLDYICCPHCGGDLTCLVLPVSEESSIGFPEDATLGEMLDHIHKSDQIGNRDSSEKIDSGLLICGECVHWFPIRETIPELLPDHLRVWNRDLDYFKTLEQRFPAAVFNELMEKSQGFAGIGAGVEDTGISFKKSEMSIKEKITDDDFFGPGYVAPFNPGNTDYTMHLIRRFGNVLPLLELKQGDVVLDMGAGYAWTTEWLMKMGVESIGVDICRTYLDIGVKRMAGNCPHLLVGDIENLPIKKNVLNAVLCYDAFHHIPDRKKAIGNFFESLKEYGNIVLAEPGGTHEFAKVSKEVMDKYGILEKGVELDELNDFCEGLDVMPPEQHYILKMNRSEMETALSSEFIHSHSYVDCNVFLVKKRLGQREVLTTAGKFKRRVKQKMKRLLKRIFYKLFH